MIRVVIKPIILFTTFCGVYYGFIIELIKEKQLKKIIS